MSTESATIKSYYANCTKAFNDHGIKRPAPSNQMDFDGLGKSRLNKRPAINNNQQMVSRGVSNINETIDLDQSHRGESINGGTIEQRRSPISLDDSFNAPEDPSKAGLDKIYFLKTRKISEVMKSAFLSLSHQTFYPRWIHIDDVDDYILNEDRPILIVESLEGPEFKTLKEKKKLQIISAFALLSLNPKKKSYIPSRDHPIASFCMKNIIICPSGLTREQHCDLKKKVRMMCGRFRPSLRKKTTHIISNRWDTEKCKLFRKVCKPVMSPEWIDRCWELREEIHDAEEVKSNLKIFAGMNICVSGFDDKRRGKIKKAVQENGGTYQTGLILPHYDLEKTIKEIDPQNKGSLTTHLIVCKKQGEKYQAAMMWGHIFIVDYNWLVESLLAGFPLLEDEYSQRDTETLRELRLKAQEKRKRELQSCTQESNSSEKEQPIVSSQSVASKENIISELEKIASLEEASDKIFDGLSFFFCGLTTNHSSIAKKVISKYGGTVYPDLVAAVTHTILGPHMTQKEALSINRHNEKIRNVSKVCLGWVVESIKEATLVDEFMDPDSSKILDTIKSTQDLDENDRKIIARSRALQKSDEMLLQMQVATSGAQNENCAPQETRTTEKKGFRMGAVPCSPKLKLTKPLAKRSSDLLSASIPVTWGKDDRSFRKEP